MPITPSELLAELNAAIETTVWWKPNAPALELTRREVLGQYGKLVDPYAGAMGRHGNRRPSAVLDDANFTKQGEPSAPEPGEPVYSFTRRQCKKLRAQIRAAAKYDLKGR